MKQEYISDALNMLDDGMIEETAAVRNGGRQRKEAAEKKGKNWWKWAAAAASIVLAAYVGIKVFPKSPGPDQETSEITKLSELPLLTIGEPSVASGMGYEGYMAYDVSELVSANPWNEDMNLLALPVYYNALSYDGHYIVSEIDFDKMREFLLEVAGGLGIDPDTLVITDNAPDETERQKILDKVGGISELPEGYFDPTELIAQGNGLKIAVDGTMTALITFDPAIALPAQYNFTHHDSSYEDMAAVAEYLKNEYKGIIGINNPQINVYGGDYNITPKQGYNIEFFNADGNESEQIVNYNFNRTAFYCNDKGELCMVRIFRPDLSKKAGDYPIITAAAARELLLNGNYITTVPYEIHGEEYVKRVELVYRTGTYEKCYMPYYRFYVELPEAERQNGLKDYGAYYVPAVDGAYISNMPVWDGRFN